MNKILQKTKVETFEISVEYPIYRTEYCDDGEFYSASINENLLVSIGKRTGLKSGEYLNTIEIETVNHGGKWSEEYYLGKGKYALSSNKFWDEFNKLINLCNEV